MWFVVLRLGTGGGGCVATRSEEAVRNKLLIRKSIALQ